MTCTLTVYSAGIMNIYNKLPEELQRLVDEYNPLREWEQRRRNMLKAIGKWTGKFEHPYSKNRVFGMGVVRATIYNTRTREGRQAFRTAAERFDRLVERMRPLATKQHSVCCMKEQSEQNLVRCRKGHAICKYKPAMAEREDGPPLYHGIGNDSLKAMRPWRLPRNNHYYSKYTCPVCHYQFDA